MVGAQTILKQEELPSSQGDFRGVLTAPNGAGVRLLPGKEDVAAGASAASRAPLAGTLGERTAEQAVEVEGALVASTRGVDAKLPVTCRVELSPTGRQTASYFDHAETLLLRTVSDAEIVNVKLQYIGKPLTEALASARFFDTLMGRPGRLMFEVPVPVEGGEPAPTGSR
jgi:hypothetical protein